MHVFTRIWVSVLYVQHSSRHSMTITHDDEIRNRLGRLNTEELAEALEFLNSFCPGAQLYISDIIQRCRLSQKLGDGLIPAAPFPKIMEILRRKKAEVWDQSLPDRFGDPDCLHRGLRNAEAMLAVYTELGFKVKGIH
jgi:hypothetical protein